MQKLKRLVSLMAILAVVLVPLCGPKMTAQADGPVTYRVKYVDDESKWRYQPLGIWDDTKGHGTIAELQFVIKNGDSLVVDGNTAGGTCFIEIPEVQLANFTALGQGSVNLTAKGVDEFYALKDVTAVVNGDIKKAYVYDYSVVNINNNVEYLEVVNAVNDEGRVHATIGVVGTVGHLYTYDKGNVVRHDLYNFKADTLRMHLGWLSTDAANYSTTAPASTTPAAPATPSTGSSSEYDDVPKTGEVPMPYLPVACVLVLCIAGKVALRKTR